MKTFAFDVFDDSTPLGTYKLKDKRLQSIFIKYFCQLMPDTNIAIQISDSLPAHLDKTSRDTARI